MSLIYKSGTYYGNGGGGSGGHSIKDNGVDMDARAALNFVDFDLTDNSGDDETDVAAHRLTSDEMAEIMSTLPGVPTELPILFDETGAERVVGWYKTSSGKKPLYEKTVKVDNVASNASGWTTVYSESTSELVRVEGYAMDTSDTTYHMAMQHGIYIPNDFGFVSLFDAARTKVNIRIFRSNHVFTVILNVQYTKTTDTFA